MPNKRLQYLETSAILVPLNKNLFKSGFTPTLKFMCGNRIAQIQKEGEGVGKKIDYEQRTESLILPILEKQHFELVDIEYVKEGSTWYLRAYIDKEGGITVNDCELVAREMNEILDREDYVDGSYVFEVSSPGLGRPLKKEKDYIRNMGKEVEIRTYRPFEHKKEFYGTLKAYDADSVTILDEEQREVVFSKSDIALIRQALIL